MKVGSIPGYCTQLFAIAVQHLWIVDILAATAVAQRAHDPINLTFKYLSQLKPRAEQGLCRTQKDTLKIGLFRTCFKHGKEQHIPPPIDYSLEIPGT